MDESIEQSDLDFVRRGDEEEKSKGERHCGKCKYYQNTMMCKSLHKFRHVYRLLKEDAMLHGGGKHGTVPTFLRLVAAIELNMYRYFSLNCCSLNV